MMNMQKRNVRRNWTVLGAIVCVGLTAACQSSEAPKAVTADVWAVVDDRQILRDEVEKAYRAAVQPGTTSEEEMLTQKLGVLDELITQDILHARARTATLEPNETELEAAFAERRRASTETGFQQQLTQRNLTADDIKSGLRRELSIQKLIDRDVMAKITVSDQQIADFYNQNRARFNLTETQYRIAQIVVTPDRDPELRNRMNDDAASPGEARRKVDMLLERLQAGADFASIALDYSEDPQTIATGGDVGFIPQSALNQAPAGLRDAVLKTQPGNVSLATSGNAYTIVRLVEREPAGQRELSSPQVRDGIRDMLRERKAQALRTAYIASARDDAKVVNHLARMVVESQGKPPSLVPTPPGK